MTNILSKRWFATALVASSAFAMTAVSFDAEARRFGGGMSSGRQSVNVTQQKQAVAPPVSAARATGAAGPATGAARWLGPVAGIAAALGLGALLAHLGLTGALADVFVLLLLASIAGLGLAFIVHALRSNLGAAAASGAPGRPTERRQYRLQAASERAPMSGLLGSAPLQVQPPPQPVVGEFFIPADFNQPVFLQEAKKQFIAIQKAWDTMDFDGLQARLTDEMYAQYAGKMAAHGGANQTEVVTLDAALLGIEKLNDGYLASVRFTGMIREDPDHDAGAFEEVWNLYKPNERGWLLAGIQQLPTH